MKPAQNVPCTARSDGSVTTDETSGMVKERIVKDDGRYLIFYRFGKRLGDRAAEGADKAGPKEGRA